LAGIFAASGLGFFSGHGLSEGVSIGSQVGVQVLGIVATIVYTAVISWLLLKVIDKVMGLRVSEEDEIQGLDITLHNERGYED